MSVKQELQVEISDRIQFYDVDAMGVVWHGNYMRFFEKARLAFFDKLGFTYLAMKAAGYDWPIVDFEIKYKAPLFLEQKIIIRCLLIEHEMRIKLKFEILDEETRSVCTIAKSTQVAVAHGARTLEFETPRVLAQKIESLLKDH